MAGDAGQAEVVAEDRNADFSHVFNGRADLCQLGVALWRRMGDGVHLVAGQVFDGAQFQAERVDEFFHPQQLEVIEHALVAEAGAVDDDVRDAHLLGELQVFFAECVEAELETEFHGRFPF